jgi:hypothetical protein
VIDDLGAEAPAFSFCVLDFTLIPSVTFKNTNYTVSSMNIEDMSIEELRRELVDYVPDSKKVDYIERLLDLTGFTESSKTAREQIKLTEEVEGCPRPPGVSYYRADEHYLQHARSGLKSDFARAMDVAISMIQKGELPSRSLLDIATFLGDENKYKDVDGERLYAYSGEIEVISISEESFLEMIIGGHEVVQPKRNKEAIDYLISLAA